MGCNTWAGIRWVGVGVTLGLAVLAVLASLSSTTVVDASVTAPVLTSEPTPEPNTEPTASALLPLGPLRLADTREAAGFERLDGSTIRVPIRARAEVPPDTVAAVVTLTVSRTSAPLFASVFPSGGDRPLVSTLNATAPGQTIANSAVVRLGVDGAIDVHLSSPAEVVVDLSGVFVAASTSSSGRLVPVVPRRVLDTRLPGGGGPLAPGAAVVVPLPVEAATDATALAVNLTVTGLTQPGYVTAHAAGSTPPWASHLNVDRAGQTRAVAAVVPVDRLGLAVTVATGGHVVVDVAGWFTGPSALQDTDGLFVPMAPRRLHDSRVAGVPVWPGGTIEVTPDPLPAWSAVVVNATATRPLQDGFVTLYPAGTERPFVSNLNLSAAARTVANLAVVPWSTRGLAAFASGGSELVIDLAGGFLGDPVVALLPPAPNDPPPRPEPSEVSLVGDSLVAALPAAYVESLAARGVEVMLDAQSSRALRWGWQCRIDGSLRIVSSPTGSGCRREGLELLSHWAASGQLRDEVIIALGNNDAPMYGETRVRSNLDTARQLIGDRPLRLVSLRAQGVLDVSMQRYNAVAASWCAADRDCMVIDWHTHPAALSASSYLRDGEHLTLAATRVRAEVVAAAFGG